MLNHNAYLSNYYCFVTMFTVYKNEGKEFEEKKGFGFLCS